MNKKTAQTSLWIFLFALAVRLLYLYQASDHPAFDHPLVDSGKYYDIARSLAQGRPMNMEFFWQVFLYPLFLSGTFKVFGVSLIAAKVVQMVIGGVTCVLVYLLAKKIFDIRVALTAALITVLYGPLIYFEGEILATGLAAFFAVLLIYLYVAAETKSNALSFFMIGLASGLAVLTRVTFLPFVVVAGVAAVFISYRKSRDNKKPVFPALALVIGFLLVALPVALQCKKVSGRFSIMPETGALNLHMGNNSANEDFMAVRPGAGWDRLLNEPIRAGVATRAEARQYFMDRFWGYLLDDPVRFTKGLLVKTGHFLSTREVPSNLDLYSLRDNSTLLAALMWKIKGFGFPFGLLLPLTLIGIALSLRRLPACFYLFLVLYPSAIVLVFVTARYRAPMVPVLALPAAAGLMAIVDRFREKRFKPLCALVAVVVAVGALCSLAGPFPAEEVNYEAESLFCLGVDREGSKDFKAARAYFEQALEFEPDLASAHEHLGYVLLQQGKTGPGLESLTRSLRIDPEIESATYALGKALLGRQEKEKALPYLEKAVKINPRSADFASTLGTAYGSLNRAQEAHEQFKRALALRPGSPNELYNLAISLYQMGELEAALVQLEAGLKAVRRTGNRALEGKIQGLGVRISNERKSRQGSGR